MSNILKSIAIGLILTSPLAACLFQTDINFPESVDAAPIDVHITERTPEDKAAWNNIKNQDLLFEKPDRTFVQMVMDFAKQSDPYAKSCEQVHDNLIKNHRAQDITLNTVDGEQIAGLVRRAPLAPITLVFATGFFLNQTPPREWAAPFYNIFSECNIVSFDWRSSGKSTGKFSHAAINDVRAALQFCHDDPQLRHTKVVLASFCMGGAIALEALHDIKNNQPTLMPDAMIMSCTPSVIADIHVGERILGLAPNNVVKGLAYFGCIRRRLINHFFDQELQELRPVNQLAGLDIPICFEYCGYKDTFAPLEDCYNNYHAARNAPVRFVIVSDLAGHVRLHKETPLQYKAAYTQFFTKAGLLQSQLVG